MALEKTFAKIGCCQPAHEGMGPSRLLANVLCLAIFTLPYFGCGGGAAPLSDQLLISRSPASQTVPLGQVATFTVKVSPSSEQVSYQWSKNGIPIEGDNTASLVTGATTLEDSGAKYAVTVSDQTVSIQSSPALLTIGPRSPADGDLRFQEVDASTTANGYTNAEGTSLIYGISYSFPDDTGSPLSVGPGCGTGAVTPYGCTWSLNVAVVPPGVAEVSTSYQVDYLEGFQSDLSALSASNSVITGLDIEPPADAVAFSSIAGTGNGAFTPVFMSVATGSISAAVATEGASGHVVTAVTYDGPDVASFVTYSWSGNADVTYDTEVMSTSYSGLSSALTSLGAQGYIVTAIGGNQQIGIMLIGTKVHGDALARSVLSVYPMAGGDLTQFGALGYAVVGMVYELGDDGNVSSVTWLGEK